MFLYAFRLLQRQPQRLFLTIAAIALCAVMMLFLLATYRGVADGSVDYIRRNGCDVWVLRQNSTNLLRGTSFLTAAIENEIRSCDGVRDAHPVLLLLPSLHRGAQRATVFLAGYDHTQRLGGPPALFAGRGVHSDSDIVLDRAFARKMEVGIGDTVSINGTRLTVCGLSTGTNAFVIQYGFVTLARARSVAGIPDLVSLYLVEAAPGAIPDRLVRRIEEKVPGTAGFTDGTFLENNLAEMESGFLPLLFAIAGIGVVVMTVILSLLLGITILERRRDFAVMKTLGAPRGYLPGSIAVYALMLALFGIAAGLGMFPLLVSLVERISPEINTVTTLPHVLLVVALCIVVGEGSALLSMRRLHSIYALEVYQ